MCGDQRYRKDGDPGLISPMTNLERKPVGEAGGHAEGMTHQE